jgi:hypothetical protein
MDDDPIFDSVWSALYVMGLFISLGMNFALHSWSWKLFWAFASWVNVGYLAALRIAS